MSCCGRREKLADLKAQHKWESINLADFRSTSCLSPLSYGVLYISLVISITVYAVDTFTAVNLLIFDRWSSQIKPFIPFDVSKWIFAACIIASFVNLIFEWIRAGRVMQRGGIAENYMDPLAVRVQSIRMGENGRGWRRFLVFGELTKGKKGVEYIALFVYFSFKAWIRVIFCEGPRKVINAFTLYSLFQAQLIPVGPHAPADGHSAFQQFWINIGILGNQSHTQVAILSGMAFTLLIWVISALSLLISCVLYILFLWHYIPSSEGLSGFCRKKVDKSLAKIVEKKSKKALEKEELKRRKEGGKAGTKGDEPPDFKRQPTLPTLDTDSTKSGRPPLLKSETMTTLPPYSSRPPTSAGSVDREPTVPDLFPGTLNNDYPPSPTSTRPKPYGSGDSTSSRAGLMGSASSMGYSQPPRGTTPAQSPGAGSTRSRPSMSRSTTADSYGRHTPGPPSRPGRAHSQRSNGYRPGPPPMPPPLPGPWERSSPAPSMRFTPQNGRRTPGAPSEPSRPPLSRAVGSSPSIQYHGETEMSDFSRNTSVSQSRSGSQSSGYVAFNPSVHSANAPLRPPPPWHARQPLNRNFTDPSYGSGGAGLLPTYRSGTAPPAHDRSGYDSIYDAYGDGDEEDSSSWPRRYSPPVRAATAGPMGDGREPSHHVAPWSGARDDGYQNRF